MWTRKLTPRLLSIFTVGVHKQSHQASRRSLTLEYCPRSSFNVPIVNDTVSEPRMFTVSLTLSPEDQLRFGSLVI